MRRIVSVLPLCAALITTVAAAPEARADGMCIPADTASRVNACPSKGAKVKKGSSVASHRQIFKRTLPKAGKMTKEAGYQLTPQQRTFREARRGRILNLVQREIQLVDRLAGNTRDDDPRKADILYRKAELLIEMQAYWNTRARELDDPIYQATRRRNTRRVQQLQQEQRQAEQQRDARRMDAVRAYAQIAQSFPQYQRMDEVLFYLGFALEEMNQYDRARQVYQRLIKGYQTSRYIPNAYLSFAEFYFQQGDMEAALRFYQKVAEYPSSQVFGYAIYKQAWCYINLQDFRAALEQFVKTIEHAQQHPEARDAQQLARQARMEMVLSYAQIGSPDRALEFFRRYAGSEDQAYEMFERLGEIFFDTGHWPEAIAVYHAMMQERPQSTKLCGWQGRVTNAVISSRPKPDQVTEVRRMLALYELIRGQSRAVELQNDCRAQSASVLIDLATHWHREAVGTESQPGTNDRNTMNLALGLYKMILEKFPDLDQVEFEGIDRSSWPTSYKVSYWTAELMWKMEQWNECGPAFDRVVELDPNGEYVSDAAYAAVLCYNNLYQQQFQATQTQTTKRRPSKAQAKKRGKAAGPEERDATEFRKRDFTELENGMLNAYTRYVCFVSGEAEDLITIKYRRARIFYEANRFEEAATIFRDIAFNHQRSELAEYAANLYLDSLNVLGEHSEPARPACYDKMAEEVPPMRELYCQGDGATAHAELCTVLQDLQCGILRKKAEAHQANRQFRDAARTYVRIAREFRECGRLDEVLYNAAINYEAARLVGRAIKAREVLIERFPDSEFSKRALYLVGANYHALAIYRKAADYYEQFASRYPGETGDRCTEDERHAGTCTNAPLALQNATFFRLGLGEPEKAIEDARNYEKLYKTRRPREVAQVVYSIGAIYEASSNWRDVVSHYTHWLRSYSRNADVGAQIQANTSIGNALWKMNDRSKAEKAFRASAKLWSGGAESRITGESDDDTTTRRLAAKTAAAQSLFYIAELSYKEFLDVGWPTYRGGRSQERFQRWVTEEFKGWKDEKEAKLNAAKALYDQVVELHIPNWEIAAAARVGDMYKRFFTAFREAPVPAEIRADEELLGIYQQSLDEASEPWKQAAIGGFEYCLTRATAVRWFNEWSTLCETELNRLDPGRFPIAAEIRAQPTHSRTDMVNPRPVLSLETTTEADVP
ncbi:MAG: tetratricopeptide repeat protein [Deltaproteobacteria bacterium]|nr:tetratricopeptide repeat protein [Deltaproteobacteria bacterium]